MDVIADALKIVDNYGNNIKMRIFMKNLLFI